MSEMLSGAIAGIAVACLFVMTVESSLILTRVTQINDSVQSIEARFYGHR